MEKAEMEATANHQILFLAQRRMELGNLTVYLNHN